LHIGTVRFWKAIPLQFTFITSNEIKKKQQNPQSSETILDRLPHGDIL
jgi:hypothetical protein